MLQKTVGVLGGGQLGRMMAEASHRLGIRLVTLDPAGCLSPAGQIAELSIEGSIQDPQKIQELATVADVVTVEIEHVNADSLEELESMGHSVHPCGRTIQIIQDKYRQKVHLAKYDIALPEFMDTPSLNDAVLAGKKFGYPFLLKNKKLAYDGRGNAVVNSESDLEEAFVKLGRDIYAEKFVPFVKELAVMVVRSVDGVKCYPVVETVQSDNICHLVIAPAVISSSAASMATAVASRAIESLSGFGIFGVELFLVSDDTVILNEIAPRPHNSGHYTIEACEVDQFEMHLRAVLGLPCPSTNMRVGAAVMINILGKSSMEETTEPLIKALSIPGAGIHWYGKSENRAGRKMAHITITGSSHHDVVNKASLLGINLSPYGVVKSTAKVAIIMGSDSDLPSMKDAAVILDDFQVPYELTIVSAHRTPTRMYTFAQSAAERGLKVIIAGAGGAAHLPGMVAALTTLPVIGVPIKTSTLNGQDSLLSIVQMPKGVPVATVAIGNAANAGLLAVRMLATDDKTLEQKMDQYLNAQEDEVLMKAKSLETVGYQSYLDNKKS